MDETKLKQIGYTVKLRGLHLKAFVHFVEIRFPDHTDEVYMEQWAERFRDGAYNKGDSQSREAFKEAYSKAFKDIDDWINKNN